MEILSQGFDHVEFVVNDPQKMRSVFTRMGFEKIGDRVLDREGTRTDVFAQGRVRLLLTWPDSAKKGVSDPSETLKFLRKHAEGICVLALEVRDATRAFNEAVKRGARPARNPTVFESAEGVVVRAEIWTPADVRYAFIERKGGRESGPTLFDEGLFVSRMESPSPLGIQVIDHLTNNVGMGQMKDWVAYYKEVFDFGVTRHFDIHTQRTGLLSDVVESADHRVKVPINEPTERESQIQEFVDRMKGAGVQHLALMTTDIQHTLKEMRANQFEFLTVPHTYYEAIPTRVQGVTENLADLEVLGVLLDGEGGGYLLQIFSQEVLGPFFFELIQRKGNEGFGEGNFRALFEAIERDQIRRGILHS